jgi:hypothetical protein
MGSKSNVSLFVFFLIKQKWSPHYGHKKKLLLDLIQNKQVV